MSKKSHIRYNYKGQGSARQARFCLEVQHNSWSATQTSWFIYLFIFLLGKSHGPQSYFLKCKTSRDEKRSGRSTWAYSL